MTANEALAIADQMDAIGREAGLLSTGIALVTLAAEVRRLRAELAAAMSRIPQFSALGTKDDS